MATEIVAMLKDKARSAAFLARTAAVDKKPVDSTEKEIRLEEEIDTIVTILFQAIESHCSCRVTVVEELSLAVRHTTPRLPRVRAGVEGN